jgi:hypothetical protein
MPHGGAFAPVRCPARRLTGRAVRGHRGRLLRRVRAARRLVGGPRVEARGEATHDGRGVAGPDSPRGCLARRAVCFAGPDCALDACRARPLGCLLGCDCATGYRVDSDAPWLLTTLAAGLGALVASAVTWALTWKAAERANERIIATLAANEAAALARHSEHEARAESRHADVLDAATGRANPPSDPAPPMMH